MRMSPISNPDPCPHIIQNGDFYFCGIYESRPDECKNHDFPSRICPVGLEKLGRLDAQQAAQRIDKGYAILTKGADQ